MEDIIISPITGDQLKLETEKVCITELFEDIGDEHEWITDAKCYGNETTGERIYVPCD